MLRLSRLFAFALTASLAAAASADETAEKNGTDFADTRVSFTLGDDNFLAGTLDNGLIPSPSLGIGDRPNFQLVFERFDRGNTGRENQTNFVMYKKTPGYLPGLITEAALVVRIQQPSAVGVTSAAPFMFDDGSFIRVAYTPGGKFSPTRNYELICFPSASERIRLGYNFNLSWGGGQAFPFIRTGSTRAPGCKAQVNSEKGYAFLAGKTQLVLERQNEAQNESGAEGNQLQNTREIQMGVLGGAGYDITSMLRAEIGGGFFQQGVQELSGVEGAPIFTGGVSTQISLHKGMPPKNTAMRDLFRNDPDAPQIFQMAERYQKGVSWLVGMEFSVLAQALADPDNFGNTKLQPALGGDLNIVVKKDHTRLWVDFGYQSLEFLTRNVPGFFPFEANPESLNVQPLLYASLRADHYIPRRRITPGIWVGVQLPASVNSVFTDAAQGLEATERTVVVREQFLADNSQVLFFDPLPKGENVTPVFASKASLKWDLSKNVSGNLEITYQYDLNRTVFEFDVENPDFVFVDPNILGGLVNLTARF
jgi:hypothetical protein